jgi:hypothetical protein
VTINSRNCWIGKLISEKIEQTRVFLRPNWGSQPLDDPVGLKTATAQFPQTTDGKVCLRYYDKCFLTVTLQSNAIIKIYKELLKQATNAIKHAVLERRCENDCMLFATASRTASPS